jgi:hypothetical protein
MIMTIYEVVVGGDDDDVHCDSDDTEEDVGIDMIRRLSRSCR